MDRSATRSRRAVCDSKYHPASGKHDERHRVGVEHWQVVPRARPAPHVANLKLVHDDAGGMYSSGMEWRWYYRCNGVSSGSAIRLRSSRLYLGIVLSPKSVLCVDLGSYMFV